MKINLASTRLAFFLLVLLAGFILISALVPQEGISEDRIVDWQGLLGNNYAFIEKLGLDSIYTSPPFLIVVALMTINLLMGNLSRIKRLRQARSYRNRFRLSGSIVFHFALTAILVGAVLNHLHRYRVVYSLTEGQTARNLPQDHFRDFSGPLCQSSGDMFEIRLDRFYEQWRVGPATAQAAEIGVSENTSGAATTGVIRTNNPLRSNGLEFHLGAHFGYSPELVVTDADGHKMFRSFVRLARQKHGAEIIDADYVLLHEGDTKIELYITAGNDPEANEKTLVMVERRGEEIYRGYPGVAGALLPDGTTVSVPRLRRWCYVEAVRNPFMNMVFAGFWVALAGLVFTLAPRLLPPPRRKLS
jgi:cytochrome c biogenesis protein ResB